MILSDSKKYWNLIAYKFCRLQKCHDFMSCIKSWAFDKKLVKEKVLQPFRCHFFYLKLYFSYIKNVERCWLDIIKKQRKTSKKVLVKIFSKFNLMLPNSSDHHRWIYNTCHPWPDQCDKLLCQSKPSGFDH